MGSGFYSYDAHESLTRSRAALPVQEVFSKTMDSAMSPRGVKVRESRDSAAHPNSLGIVFALDVTGSMGNLPAALAKESLPKFMRILLELGVPDPQVLFTAVGDFECDRHPLQVGQFESSAQLMDRWLTGVFLEGGGGGNAGESYATAAQWIAEHSAMDCYEKRQRKGYLFITGDEPSLDPGTSVKAQAQFGEGWESPQFGTVRQAFAKAAEKFHVFFVIPDRSRAERVERYWREILGDHVVVLSTHTHTAEACGAIVAITEGVADVQSVRRGLVDMGVPESDVRGIVAAVTPYAATVNADGVPSPLRA